MLTDGTYELIPDSEGGDLEAQVNTAVLTEAPDQSSEEPRAEIVSDYQEGKPRCINPIIINAILIYVLIMYLCI